MEKLSLHVDGNVANILFHSPPANALSSGLLKELSEVLDQIEHNRTVKAIVIQGEGKFFSAGADIKEFTSLQNADDYTSLAQQGQQIFDRMEKFHIPIIASIHGAALGGGLELAMSCHIRIVTHEAKLGLPELTLGIIPGFAGTQRLPRYVGIPKAYEMILTGRPITGDEAVQLGLANHAVTEDELKEFTSKLVSKIVDKSAPSINAIMGLIPFTYTSQFQTGVYEEAKSFGNIFGTEDAKEGVQAFIEKRKPNFKDK
ncbi:enoyl-CoA hydratase [Salirhabdus euzebyi]|uniref:Enoyl-CoA hydratase n=1 Tax=Salirhabdus euzebyi TaxID=394506 RepID=A0A841PT88_9BACI|nr:enoyl-CoA hydratase [Salirhabdus euzebyi]MBB6452039.1 enoyl-CoA hydratase [Salirhabdus euzebyi]